MHQHHAFENWGLELAEYTAISHQISLVRCSLVTEAYFATIVVQQCPRCHDELHVVTDFGVTIGDDLKRDQKKKSRRAVLET